MIILNQSITFELLDQNSRLRWCISLSEGMSRCDGFIKLNFDVCF